MIYIFFNVVRNGNVGGLIIRVGNVYIVEDLQSLQKGLILTHFSTKDEL